MVERVESVGGTLVVTDRSGGGVVVEARVPFLMGHPEQGTSFPTSRIFLEQVMETIADGYTAVDADWRYVYVNRAAYALLHRDPADSLIGKRLWDEFDIAPEFAAAYHRARDEGVEVEVTGYHEPWDTWIFNRVLPTAGGLSIFGRNVTEPMRVRGEARTRGRWSAPVAPSAWPSPPAVPTTRRWSAPPRSRSSSRGRCAACGWCGRAARSTPASCPARSAGSRSRWTASEVGAVELVGEEDPVDPDVLQLLAVRLSAAVSGT